MAQNLAAAEWLKSIRRNYELDKKFIVPKEWLKDFIERLPSSSRATAQKVWEARQGMTVFDVLNDQLEGYLRELLPILNTEERKLADATFFGILPTHKFSAYSGYSPRGDRIVILHHALTSTLAFWAHWFARLQDEGKQDYLSKKPSELIHTLAFIVQVWLGRIPEGKFPDIYPKTVDSWRLSECLAVAAITFVIAHELGHVFSGHARYSVDMMENHAMEYEADRIGLSLLIRHGLVKVAVNEFDTYFTKFILFGPLFALAVSSLLVISLQRRIRQRPQGVNGSYPFFPMSFVDFIKEISNYF